MLGICNTLALQCSFGLIEVLVYLHRSKQNNIHLLFVAAYSSMFYSVFDFEIDPIKILLGKIFRNDIE